MADIDLADLEAFAAVARARSFRGAATARGGSASTLSEAVRRLEARLGVRLFDRTPQAVRLTEEGRQFHAQVAPLLAGLEDAAADASATAGTVRGRLRVN